jgi:REP element-mobilizing transposase RayT
MWNLPPPPGFVGFDPEKPKRIYYRTLPHWRQEGVTYFTTFRLGDSLPEGRLRELAELRARWEKANPAPRSEEKWLELARTTFEHVERWLDEGSGGCVLAEKFAADIVEEKLQFFAGQQFELGAYVLMPNHVHVLVRPFTDSEHPLERIEQGWKAYSTRDIHRVNGGSGSLWQLESFDRIVRDEEHLWRCLQYIGNNPQRAGLRLDQIRRWVNPVWVQAGWDFENVA